MLSVLVLISAQVALPLTPRHAGGISYLVITALGIAGCVFATVTWGLSRVLRVALCTYAATMAIEIAGVRTGVPFGNYSYTRSLQPQLWDVPLLIGLAWFSMLLPAWEVARRITPHRFIRSLMFGAGLMIWDLFLDPMMLGYGFWRFDNPSGWQGVPFSNTFGWFASGAVVSLVPMYLLPERRANNGLAFLYVWMIGFSALGYALPFALDDPEIGVVGTLIALPVLYLALRRRERSWLVSPS